MHHHNNLNNTAIEIGVPFAYLELSLKISGEIFATDPG